MTLYEMLDRTTAVQEVWIFETNTYDQNMPLFKGNVGDARVDRDSLVWSYLMCEVEYYDCSYGILDIRLKDEYYNFHLEDHYLSSGKWGTTEDKRPWRYSIEIRNEKVGEKLGRKERN